MDCLTFSLSKSLLQPQCWWQPEPWRSVGESRLAVGKLVDNWIFQGGQTVGVQIGSQFQDWHNEITWDDIQEVNSLRK